MKKLLLLCGLALSCIACEQEELASTEDFLTPEEIRELYL